MNGYDEYLKGFNSTNIVSGDLVCLGPSKSFFGLFYPHFLGRYGGNFGPF